MDNMTALVSAYARAYHYKNNRSHIFADPLAQEMLTDEEYAAVSQNMSQGISYFAPGFRGTQEEALRFIVDHQLSPSVLARSAFCERAVGNAVMLGCRQIILFACGYDTFSLRTNDNRLQVFELDRPEMIADRQRRIRTSGLEPGCRQVCIGCESRRNRELAAAAGEQMKAQYSRDELEKLLSEAGFLVYEHLDAEEAAETFFQNYNRSNMEHCMTAPEGVGYCLAVKQAE